ncbi:MAG: efflux RND transporter periplasmic adaptor subunit [Deltaproteobacteria bacterium]|nr:efflux RND transporter periplasmic adaptor subunit [Deltaproteobacteria bacterium]
MFKFFNFRFVFVLAFIVSFTFFGCGKKEEQGEGAGKGTKTESHKEIKESKKKSGGGGTHGHGGMTSGRAISVRVELAKKQEFKTYITALGTLEADEEVVIRSELEAILTRVLRDEGEDVSKGTVLAFLDEEKFRLKVDKAEADLKKATSDSELSEKDFFRKAELRKEAVITEQDFDEARARASSSQAALESARAAYNLARNELENSRIKAPFAGFIASRSFAPGSYIKKGEALFTLIDTSPIKVSAMIPERRLLEVEVGQEVELKLGKGVASKSKPYKGKIYFISPRIDTKSRSFEIKAKIKNPKRKLRPGLFADVSITTGVEKNAFLLPEKAVLLRDGKNIVFVAFKGIAVRVEVEVGGRVGSKVSVLSGIDEGDAVIVEGGSSLKDGASVKVIE